MSVTFPTVGENNGWRLCECGCGELTPILTRNRVAQGHVVGHPARFVNGHAARKKHGPRYLEEDRGYKTPCWIWQGSPDGANGYGRTGHRPAHRVYYEQKYGPIPEGLVPDHLCCVSLCVNPDHIEPVTITENNRRRRFNKLTLEDARELRAFRDEFFRSAPLNTKGQPRKRFPQGVLGQLAERYGCSKITIISVLKERTWA